MPTSTRSKPEAYDFRVEYQPHPKQLEIMRSPARFKVVAAGRRGGKTEMAAAISLFGDASGRVKGAIQGDKIWWVAPEYGRTDIGWRLAKRFAENIPTGIKRISEQHMRIEFPHSEGWLQMMSGFDPDTLRGEGLDYVILDEAAFMRKREVWSQAIRPALSDRKGGALFISTPKGFNFFYDLYERGERRMKAEDGGSWESFHFTSFDNPHVDDAEIEETKREYVEDGLEWEFNQEYLAQFLEGAGQPVFPRKWWSGQNRYDPNDERLLRSGIGWWIAADTANKDKDEHAYSVFVVGQFTPRYELLVREVIRGRWTFDQLPGMAVQLARRYRGHYQNSLRQIYIEDQQSGTALLQVLRHSAPSWIAQRAFPIRAIPKEISWNEAAVWCRRGFVKLPYPDESNAHWLMPLETELFNVPGARFFDQADAFSILVRQRSLDFAAAYRRRAA